MTSLLSGLGLRFADAEMEGEFRQEFCVRLRPQIQVALLLGAVIYYVFFVWDRMIDPGRADLTHGIRAALAGVDVLFAVILFSRRSEPFLEEIQTGLMIAANLGLTIIYSLLQRGFEFGQVGIVLVNLFSLGLLRSRLLYSFVFLMTSWLAFIGAQVHGGGDQLWLLVTNNLVIACSSVIGLYSAYSRELDGRKQFVLKRELNESKRRVQELVGSMLPAHVVERMTAGETRIADSHGEVTIVFADLVGFTRLTKQVAPRHLVEILNQLFSSFDDLASRHRIEKIKTIGDCYMAVAGMEQGDSGHTERAAEFAFGLLRSVEALSRATGMDLNVRVGLHVGPVIAGVIGSMRPAFDCWGDTVNIASRMESSGTSGGIQVSEAARWRLQDKYRLVENTAVDIKGIGVTKTYSIHLP